MLGQRIRAWHKVEDPNHKQCALAAMFASGSADFGDIIIPLLTSENDQVRLGAYRVWPDFQLSGLPSMSERVHSISECHKLILPTRQLTCSGHFSPSAHKRFEPIWNSSFVARQLVLTSNPSLTSAAIRPADILGSLAPGSSLIEVYKLCEAGPTVSFSLEVSSSVTTLHQAGECIGEGIFNETMARILLC